MPIINLRQYYPFYEADCFIEVTDTVAEVLRRGKLQENAYRLRVYRHKAYYSLDRGDGLEHDALFVALSPYELYERKLTMEQLDEALAALPDKQARRVYAHYILSVSKAEIARAEVVSEGTIRESIKRGLCNLEKYLKNFL